MKKFILILTFLLSVLFSSPIFAGDIIPDFSEKSVVTLNERLRKIENKLLRVKSSSSDSKYTYLDTAIGDLSLEGLRDWTQDMTFSSTDNDTVAWTSGTISLSDSSTSYSIDAGDTGTISALTYIYLDTDTSATVLQKTTTAATAVGANKILIGVAENVADATKYATFQVFGGSGGVGGTLITADNIATNTLTANEIVANTITASEIAALTITAGQIATTTITAAKMNVSTLSSITANIGSITSGTVTGATVQTNTSGARVKMDTTELIAYDNASGEVFKIELTGANVGDVTIGNYGGTGGVLWDKSEGLLSVDGTIYADGGTVAGWTIAADRLSHGTDADYIGLLPGTGIQMGDSTFADAEFSVTNAGALKATSGTIGGWTIGATTLTSTNITIDSGNELIKSNDFVSGALGKGWQIDSNWAEFQNVYARGILRSMIFEYETISAMGGTFLISHDADKLNADMGAADASTALVTEGNVTFAVGDFLRMKALSDTGVDDEWLEVSSVTDAENYVVIRDKAGNYADGSNPEWTEGTAIVNFGQNADGGILMTASENNSPHIDVYTINATPWDSGITTRMRLGNLNGFLGYSSDLYGIAIGEANKYLKYDSTNGLRIKGTIIVTGTSSGYDQFSDKPADLGDINATEGTKLTGIETSATTDQTGAEIKTAYQAEANAYTDTKNTKLSGVETGANVTGDHQGDVNIDNIADGSTYKKATVNEQTGAQRAYADINASGNFIGAIDPAHNAPVSGAGLYIGADCLGYYDSTNWKTYMNNTGNFYLGGSGGALQWNGTTLIISSGTGSSYAGDSIATTYTAAKCTNAAADQTSANTAANAAAYTGTSIATTYTAAKCTNAAADQTSANTAANAAAYTGTSIATTYTAAKCTNAAADQTSANTAADTSAVSGVASLEIPNRLFPDAYTKALIHFNGTDGATTHTAETGQTVTFEGTAQLDTAQKEFGTASLLLDGNSDYVTLPDSDDWYFGDGDFTVDCWVRFDSNLVAAQPVCGQYVDGAHFWGFARSVATSRLSFYAINGAVDVHAYSSWNPSIDTWYHLEFVRDGATAKIFIDGVSQAVTLDGWITMPNFATTLSIGFYEDALWYLDGWVDEFRISKGVGRHISNFTPETSEYSFSSHTLTPAIVESWQHATDTTYIDGGSIYSNSILLAKLGSEVSDRFFDSSGASDNVQAWAHSENATLIDGGDIYANTITVAKINADATNRMFDDSTKSTNIQGWIKAGDVTKIDGGDISTGTVTADKITAGTFVGGSFIVGAGGDIRSSNYSAGTTGFLLHPTTGLEVNTGTIKGNVVSAMWGTWVSRSSGTIYQAATDGFLTTYTAAHYYMNVATDSSTPPTTVRAQVSDLGDDADDSRGATMTPVKKNDYYRINQTTGSSTAYWLPLGG